MFDEFFSVEKTNIGNRPCTVVKTKGRISLADTLECGQCFRHILLKEQDGYVEYLITVGEELITVGQEIPGELIFYGIEDDVLTRIAVPYFTLCTDYEKIRADVVGRTDSAWLIRAAELASGIAILKQDLWEVLLSFIISQNNNIPRIKKIIRQLSAEYGVNLALQKGLENCPCGLISGTPCEEKCRECGICYTFPKPCDIVNRPEGMLSSHPGFRYKYMLDAAERVTSGETNLEAIDEAHSYEHTLCELKKIKGVGDKVASCVALFGFSNLEAFPIDVWMKRAIDEYFDGKLDPNTLGPYAGVAQQYIFHYIRNLSRTEE